MCKHEQRTTARRSFSVTHHISWKTCSPRSHASYCVLTAVGDQCLNTGWFHPSETPRSSYGAGAACISQRKEKKRKKTHQCRRPICGSPATCRSGVRYDKNRYFLVWTLRGLLCVILADPRFAAEDVRYFSSPPIQSPSRWVWLHRQCRGEAPHSRHWLRPVEEPASHALWAWRPLVLFVVSSLSSAGFTKTNTSQILACMQIFWGLGCEWHNGDGYRSPTCDTEGCRCS